MNITVKNEHAAEILLGKDEMDSMGITYEELDYANAETRRVLWSLLDEIRKKAAVDISFSGKLLIEVMKESKGSVRICFTSLSGNEKDPKSVKQLIKSEDVPILAEFTDFEMLLSTVPLLQNVSDSLLYVKNGRFRLAVYSEKRVKSMLEALLCEFGEASDDPFYEFAVCREMWDCIIASDAVKVLSSVFLRNQ